MSFRTQREVLAQVAPDQKLRILDEVVTASGYQPQWRITGDVILHV